MVEIIQRYVLSATAGAGSLNCLPIMQARRFRYGLNNNHDHPLTFVENNKNTFHSKKSPKKSLLYWLLGASERGAQDQGHSDVPCYGKTSWWLAGEAWGHLPDGGRAEAVHVVG